MKVLEVESITKRFASILAVDQLSFSTEEGVVFGLLGPNGAGKTTTIRMIMNIIVPDSGRISLLGKTDPVAMADRIGYLPEERGLYRKMKVKDLMLFLCELKGLHSREAKRRMDEWLGKMELAEWKNKKIEELSKGMQQKLQFIGTIIHEPKLLILDEPFMGLDPVNTNTVKNILLDLKAKGTSIILSTHLMENAEKLCDEILLIDHGKDVLSGRLSDVKKRFGKHNLAIEFDGNDSFLKSTPGIDRFDHYGNMVEIVMKKDGDPQEVLHNAMKKAVVKKFEIKEPSLNDIFIEMVQGRKSEGKKHE